MNPLNLIKWEPLTITSQRFVQYFAPYAKYYMSCNVAHKCCPAILFLSWIYFSSLFLARQNHLTIWITDKSKSNSNMFDLDYFHYGKLRTFLLSESKPGDFRIFIHWPLAKLIPFYPPPYLHSYQILSNILFLLQMRTHDLAAWLVNFSANDRNKRTI